MKKKGNSVDFDNVVHQGITQDQVDHHLDKSPDLIVKYYHNNYYYRTDYRDAILQYYRACGCRVYSLDFLEISISKPTISVDPIHWYDNVYTPKFYWSPIRKNILAFIIVILLVWFCNIQTGGIQ